MEKTPHYIIWPLWDHHLPPSVPSTLSTFLFIPPWNSQSLSNNCCISIWCYDSLDLTYPWPAAQLAMFWFLLGRRPQHSGSRSCPNWSFKVYAAYKRQAFFLNHEAPWKWSPPPTLTPFIHTNLEDAVTKQKTFATRTLTFLPQLSHFYTTLVVFLSCVYLSLQIEKKTQQENPSAAFGYVWSNGDRKSRNTADIWKS